MKDTWKDKERNERGKFTRNLDSNSWGPTASKTAAIMKISQFKVHQIRFILDYGSDSIKKELARGMEKEWREILTVVLKIKQRLDGLTLRRPKS